MRLPCLAKRYSQEAIRVAQESTSEKYCLMMAVSIFFSIKSLFLFLSKSEHLNKRRNSSIINFNSAILGAVRFERRASMITQSPEYLALDAAQKAARRRDETALANTLQSIIYATGQIAIAVGQGDIVDATQKLDQLRQQVRHSPHLRISQGRYYGKPGTPTRYSNLGLIAAYAATLGALAIASVFKPFLRLRTMEKPAVLEQVDALLAYVEKEIRTVNEALKHRSTHARVAIELAALKQPVVQNQVDSEPKSTPISTSLPRHPQFFLGQAGAFSSAASCEQLNKLKTKFKAAIYIVDLNSLPVPDALQQLSQGRAPHCPTGSGHFAVYDEVELRRFLYRLHLSHAQMREQKDIRASLVIYQVSYTADVAHQVMKKMQNNGRGYDQVAAHICAVIDGGSIAHIDAQQHTTRTAHTRVEALFAAKRPVCRDFHTGVLAIETLPSAPVPVF